MANHAAVESTDAADTYPADIEQGDQSGFSRVKAFYAHPWTQIVLISFICFCCPGVSTILIPLWPLTNQRRQMYNALGGLGGSGQVDPTVAANATVALLACTAGTALFVVGPLFTYTGPRLCLMLGGWTYALYSGSLLNFNRK